jgi:hypothetical protein
LNFIFSTVCLYVCVCAFSLRQESPDMILGDEPLISDQSLYKTDSNYIALIKACIKKIDQSFITTNILHLQVTPPGYPDQSSQNTLTKIHKMQCPKLHHQVTTYQSSQHTRALTKVTPYQVTPHHQVQPYHHKIDHLAWRSFISS